MLYPRNWRDKCTGLPAETHKLCQNLASFWKGLTPSFHPGIVKSLLAWSPVVPLLTSKFSQAESTMATINSLVKLSMCWRWRASLQSTSSQWSRHGDASCWVSTSLSCCVYIVCWSWEDLPQFNLQGFWSFSGGLLALTRSILTYTRNNKLFYVSVLMDNPVYIKNAKKRTRQHARIILFDQISFCKVVLHWRSSYTKGSLPPPPKVVFHQRSSSTEGRLPPKVAFHRRLSSTQGCLPPKVTFHQKSSSTEGYLPPKLVFPQKVVFHHQYFWEQSTYQISASYLV